ncbi:hypothetical protein BH23PSE2_BH23PSE2_07720 [soil metagenome]
MSDSAPEPTIEPRPGQGAWQRLPPRAQTLFVLGNLVAYGIAALVALVAAGLLLPWEALKLPLSLALLALLPLLGVWLARKQYRHTWWRLDAQGFALRRGRMWHQETRVPTSRVQHLDLKRGPLERRFGLATLTIHTAGTRHSAVSVGGLDADDAERLRDLLGRQIDGDDDD